MLAHRMRYAGRSLKTHGEIEKAKGMFRPEFGLDEFNFPLVSASNA